jgi:hypothetical protein
MRQKTSQLYKQIWIVFSRDSHDGVVSDNGIPDIGNDNIQRLNYNPIKFKRKVGNGPGNLKKQ